MPCTQCPCCDDCPPGDSDCELQILNTKEKIVMQEFQSRVVSEKAELEEKITKLQAFMSNDGYQSLPNDEQARMARQLSLMTQYSEVLSERIAAFVKR